MFRKIIAAVAFAAVSSTFAIAADQVPVDEQVVIDDVRFDWNGGYVGIHGGYNHFVDDYQDPIPPYFGTLNGNGGLAGAHSGVNYQMDNLVLGIEGDISWVHGSGQSMADNYSEVFGKAEANWEASIRARAGIAIDNWLIYATGGFAWANYDFDYTSPSPAGFGQGDQFSETVHGYTVGGGVEYAFNSEWTARLEYRYSDYGTASSGIVNCCEDRPNRQDHDLTTQTVRIGLTRLF